MDGSSIRNLGLAARGLIRYENGSWVIGFIRKIGRSTSFMAEQYLSTFDLDLSD